MQDEPVLGNKSNGHILFASSRLICVFKPAGVLSVPTRLGISETRPIMGLMLEKHLGQRIWPLHRLDLEVSGILLFALDPESHRTLSLEWENSDSVKKRYFARSISAPCFPTNDSKISAETLWENRIAMGKKRAYYAEHGKLCSTEIKYVGTQEKYGHLLHNFELVPLTGRRHQLRFEMSAHGMPIWGDRLYGAEPVSDPPVGISLTSYQISFADKKLQDYFEFQNMSLESKLNFL